MSSTPPAPPQRGRESETRRVDEALDCACTGGNALMYVVGPRGMGKTRMLQEAAETARRRGFRLVRGETRAAAPGDSVPTLVVVDEPFRTGARPDREALGPRPSSHTVWMTASPAGTPPRRADGIDVPPFLCTTRLVLGPLSTDAVRDLASDLLGARPDGPLLRLLEQVGGHPGLLIELIRGLQEEGSVRTVSGVAELVTSRVSEQACFYVRDTLAGSSGLCRQLLCLMALLDDGCGPQTLSRLLGISTVALIPVLEEAYATGLLHDQGGAPAFVSLLARCLVAETVPQAVRTALRRERAALGGATAHPPPRDEPAGPELDERQRLMVRLVAEGLTNQEMAGRLRLSPHTVNYHLRKLFRTFGVGSRIDLLNAAARAGVPVAPAPRDPDPRDPDPR
ncbi:LuxR C-terminal-related transcriptional regulator [Streptomyces cyaneofuscatus]|uniref:LuxR C-terminal-related transcriptional regulator n=1 Tax=Streptomyces cyaneofuscatus TaxID=66883 RepID=A0ABZ1F0K7_9ACTN|nr:LuxR C-terminal-related transcriptional regulator [Streptomyces cyaneofuscatus]WSB09955.1 LuxR C-terminal-related transcriptional regulator [Streptomyces cyaneofuscatus]WSD46512.1 LuxR C-terminal-related transcriptional regulator [Streptomyces cyaneofuscatus]WTA89888.1 LuxR C-terminal-related transcriptional regulator [Streptomyces cyaneofuscatus]